jgi:tetratricopeptide (TPR) repeat protein
MPTFASFHLSVARMREFASRFVALTACASMSFAPAMAAAALAGPALAAPAQAEAPDADQAEAMFRRGQAKYETADYNGAIELWTEAYALVDSSTENASIKALLIYNLAQAHLKAFELDKDQIHLKQALQLLQSFRSNLTLIHEDPTEIDEETRKVEERIKEVEGMLAELERAEAREDPDPAPTEAPIEAPIAVVEPAQDAEPKGQDARSGTPLIAAGGTIVGLGALFGVTGIVGGLLASSANDISDLERDDLIGREDQFATGRAGNAMLIVGSVGAGVLVPTGVALLVVGVLRNKQLDRHRAALPRSTPRVGPSFGGVWGMGGGLTLSGEF